MDYIIAIFITNFFSPVVTHQQASQPLEICTANKNLEEVSFSTKNFSIDDISYIKIPTKWKKQ